MHMTPDQSILWQWSFLHLNVTMVYTWVVMVLLTLGSWLVTRRLADPDEPRSRWQNALEVVVETIRGQIREVCPQGGEELPAVCRHAVPVHRGVESAGHCSGLACADRLAFHDRGAGHLRRVSRYRCSESRSQGFVGYFRSYLRPTLIMLPFHLLSETSRNLALAVRLFGNIMSGSMIVGVLLAIAPLFLPGAHAGAGTADRYDSGLHFRDSGDGLHRRRGAARPEGT